MREEWLDILLDKFLKLDLSSWLPCFMLVKICIHNRSFPVRLSNSCYILLKVFFFNLRIKLNHKLIIFINSLPNILLKGCNSIHVRSPFNNNNKEIFLNQVI